MGNGLNALEALDPSLFEEIYAGLLDDGPVVQHDKNGNMLFTLTSAVDIFKEWNPRVINLVLQIFPLHRLPVLLAPPSSMPASAASTSTSTATTSSLAIVL